MLHHPLLLNLDDRMTLKEKLAFIIKKRLEYNIPVVKQGRWSEALATTTHPSVLPSTLEKIALVADEICFQSGDNTSDVRASTLALFWLTFRSVPVVFQTFFGIKHLFERRTVYVD